MKEFKIDKVIDKYLNFLILCCILIFMITPVKASDFNEQLKNLRESMQYAQGKGNTSLVTLGEEINPLNGKLNWTTTDLSIPGVMGMDINISRVYDYHDKKGQYGTSYFSEIVPENTSSLDLNKVTSIRWKLDLPNISLVKASSRDTDEFGPGIPRESSNLCEHRGVVNIRPNIPGVSNFVSINKRSNEQLYPDNLEILFDNNWILVCEDSSIQTTSYLTDENNRKAAISSTVTLISPKGKKYRFFNADSHKYVASNPVLGSVNITDYFNLKIAEIEDRFGNKINFHYKKPRNPATVLTKSGYWQYNQTKSYFLLTSITSSDNRTVTFQYHDSSNINERPFIQYISYKEKTIEYIQEGGLLKSVILPDGLSWNYEYYPGSFKEKHLLKEVNSPLGIKINYAYQSTKSSDVCDAKNYCFTQYSHPTNSSYDESYKIAVKSKTFNLNGNKSYTENYNINYKENYVETIVNSPNMITEYKFHRLSKDKSISNQEREKTAQLDGKIFTKSIKSVTGKTLENQIYEYDILKYSGKNWSRAFHLSEQVYKVVNSKLLTRRNGVDYSVAYSNYNEYGYPQIIEESNSKSSKTRYQKNMYFNDKANWIIGLNSESQLSENGINYISVNKTEFKQFSFLGSTSSQFMPHKRFSNGLLQKTLVSYHPNGQLKRIEFNQPLYSGVGNRFLILEDYKFGTAQKITEPLSASPGVKVKYSYLDDFSRVWKDIDYLGNIVTYEYDDNDRLTLVNYGDNRWADIVIDYQMVQSDEYYTKYSSLGILRKKVTQGNLEQRTYFDAMLRPIFTAKRDLSNSEVKQFQTTHYDYYNREIHRSFISDLAYKQTGIKTFYDALGRKTLIHRESDNARTTVEYDFNNNQIITDPKGHKTTTSFIEFGTPNHKLPNSIKASDMDEVIISYNLFNQVTDISQGQITEKRLYDSNQRLCKVVRPETGITVFNFNSIGELNWKAVGVSSNTINCNVTGLNNSDKIRYRYDNLGSVKYEYHPQNTHNKIYTYDKNSNLKQLSSWSTKWSYKYNSLNLLELETLNIDNKNFVIDKNYDSLGNLSSLTYPTGLKVDYLPNALGFATKAGKYAREVKYHPSGQLRSFTYGNGITRKVELDETNRIESINDKLSSTSIVNLELDYDFNDNLDSLIDHQNPTYSLSSFSYDGTNKLKDVSGAWGVASYNYDGLGNIKSRSIGNSTSIYKYDQNNRLSSIGGQPKFRYDSRGNITNNNRFTLNFNLANQLVSAGSFSFKYDGHERRVAKINSSGTYYTVYDANGKLLNRVDLNNMKTDLIYLGNTIVAEVDTNKKIPALDPQPKPEITIEKYSSIIGRDGCPEFGCYDFFFSGEDFEPLNPFYRGTNALHIYWTVKNADICQGYLLTTRSVLDDEVGNEIEFDEVYTSYGAPLSVPIEYGAEYEFNFMCAGPGGQTSVEMYLSESDLAEAIRL